MYDHFLSLADLIQLALMLFACYACYRRGINVGTVSTLEKLESLGVIKLQREGDGSEESEEK
jgi:hypothetical protein